MAGKEFNRSGSRVADPREDRQIGARSTSGTISRRCQIG